MSRSRAIRPVADPGHGLVAGLGLLTVIPIGIAIGRGWGFVGLAAMGLAWLYGLICVRWRRAFYGLLLYLPFAGVVIIALFPWKAPLLFKDLLFAVPAYLGFSARLALHRESLQGLPRLPIGLMMALGLLVVVQIANPGVENLLMGLIGLKVWLFYLPLFLLSFALVPSERDLFLLLRLLVGLSFIPAIIGITEAVLAQVVGYQSTMLMLYGELAASATQGFAQFEIGHGVLARIPSTFSFWIQYFGYTLAMLVPCYAVWRGDPSPWWRQLGGWALLIVTLASFLSGARSAFVFVPLLFFLILGLERGFSGLVRSGVYVVATLFGAVALLRIGSFALYELISMLFFHYAEDIAYGGLVQAIVSAPWGTGTGTNTGPARYAFMDPKSFIAIENYYAKAAYELGLPGLFLVVSLFLSLVFLGYRSHRKLRRAPLRACSAGLLAFLVVMVLNSFKGWLVDLDPVNIYFWVFAGILLKLPALDSIARRDGIVAWPVPSADVAASAGAFAYEAKKGA
jgi:hypothetical protein